jgi:hypothetical protein
MVKNEFIPFVCGWSIHLKKKWQKLCIIRHAQWRIFLSVFPEFFPEQLWLIDYLLSYVSLKTFSFVLRRYHYQQRAAKFRPMFGAQGRWAGRNLYCAIPAVTHGFGFSGLIRRASPFSRLFRHTRGCGGSILTRLLTGFHWLGVLVFRFIKRVEYILLWMFKGVKHFLFISLLK